MIWTSLLIILLVTFYLYDKRKKSYWSDKGAKQTNPVFFFGDNLRLIFKREGLTEFWSRLYNIGKGQRYMGFYQFQEAFLIILDPDLIKQITVKDFDHFTDHRQFVPEEIDPLWAKNLLALRGKKWHDMRVTLSPSFTSSKIKNLFILIKESAQKFILNFENDNEKVLELDFKDTFLRFTNDIIATTAFGIEVDSIKNKENEFYLMSGEIRNSAVGGSFFKILLFLFLPKLAGILGLRFFGEKSSSFFKTLVQETIKHREEHNIIRPDVLNLLMKSRHGLKEKDEPVAVDTGYATVHETKLEHSNELKHLTDEEIAAQCLIFFLAGFDTVSTVMSFLSHELAVNQDIQDTLRKEIIETNNTCNGNLTYEALMKMKYLDMVITEILRKYPISHMDRVCTKEYTIDPVTPDEKPLVIPVNMQLLIPTFAIHRDPEFYPNPDKFDPERFSEENKHNIRPYTYLPFGTGPRNCIGSRFAILEAKTLCFYLLLKLKIVPTKKSCIPMVFTKKSFQIGPEGGFWYGFERVDVSKS